MTDCPIKSVTSCVEYAYGTIKRGIVPRGIEVGTVPRDVPFSVYLFSPVVYHENFPLIVCSCGELQDRSRTATTVRRVDDRHGNNSMHTHVCASFVRLVDELVTFCVKVKRKKN